MIPVAEKLSNRFPMDFTTKWLCVDDEEDDEEWGFIYSQKKEILFLLPSFYFLILSCYTVENVNTETWREAEREGKWKEGRRKKSDFTAGSINQRFKMFAASDPVILF